VKHQAVIYDVPAAQRLTFRKGNTEVAVTVQRRDASPLRKACGELSFADLDLPMLQMDVCA